MANWCNHYCDITVDSEHENKDKFEKFLELMLEKAKKHNKVGNGIKIYGHPIFFLEPRDNGDDIDFIELGFSTKWSPIPEPNVQKLMEAFPCIVSIEMEYEESGNCVYGIINATREDGEVEVTRSPAPDVFVYATSMRDNSFDNPYKSIEDVCERCGLKPEQVNEVLKKTKKKIEDFSENMEIFDLEDFI